jgi:FkbM family methyltransferase
VCETTLVKHAIKTLVANTLGLVRGDTEGFVTLRTLRGPARGMRLRLDLKRRLEYAYWLGRYDEGILSVLQHLVKPGQTVWDCGTYLGYYTCFFARAVGHGGRVVSLEPDAANLARTRWNAALNGFSHVTFVHKAVAGSSGTVELLVSESTNSHLSGVYIGGSREEYRHVERVDRRVTVASTSLDDAYFVDGLPRPDLIKIDIEGAEAFALAGSVRLCHEVGPTIILELHNPDCDRAAWEWARDTNYEMRPPHGGAVLTRLEDVRHTVLCTPRDRSR